MFREETDLSDSLIDMCCCALGAFVLLMVLVVPEPTGVITGDGDPVERPITFEIRLPVRASLGNSPGLGDDFYGLDYALTASRLHAVLIVNSDVEFDQQLELGDERINVKSRHFGNIQIETQRVECEKTWLFGERTRFDAPAGVEERSELRLSFTLNAPPADDSLWPIAFELQLRCSSPACRYPKELDRLWELIVAEYSSLGFTDIEPSHTTPAFCAATVTVSPDQVSLTKGLRIIPVYLRLGPNALGTGLGYTNKSDYYKWAAAAFPTGFLYQRDERSLSNSTWVDIRARDAGGGEGGLQLLDLVGAEKEFHFVLSWIGTITIDTSEVVGSPQASIAMEFLPSN